MIAVEWRVELRVESARLLRDLDQPRLVVERAVVRLLDRRRGWLTGVGLHCALLLQCVLCYGSGSSWLAQTRGAEKVKRMGEKKLAATGKA